MLPGAGQCWYLMMSHGRGRQAYISSQVPAGTAGEPEDYGSADAGPLVVTDLYFTRADLAGAPGLAVRPAEVLRRAEAAAGRPFMPVPDGSYDLELNRFFRELPGRGARSAASRSGSTSLGSADLESALHACVAGRSRQRTALIARLSNVARLSGLAASSCEQTGAQLAAALTKAISSGTGA